MNIAACIQQFPALSYHARVGDMRPQMSSPKPLDNETEDNSETRTRRKRPAGSLVAKTTLVVGVLTFSTAATACSSTDDDAWPSEPVARWTDWAAGATIPDCQNGADLTTTGEGSTKVRPLLSNNESNSDDNFSTIVEIGMLQDESRTVYSFAADGAGVPTKIPKDIYEKARTQSGTISIYAANSPFENLPEEATASLVHEIVARGQGDEDLASVATVTDEDERFFSLCRQLIFRDGKPHDTVTPGNYFDYNEPPTSSTTSSTSGSTQPSEDPNDTEARAYNWQKGGPPLECKSESYYTSTGAEYTTLVIELEQDVEYPNQAYAVGGTIEWTAGDSTYLRSMIRAGKPSESKNRIGANVAKSELRTAAEHGGTFTVWSMPVPDEAITPINNGDLNGAGSLRQFMERGYGFDTLDTSEKADLLELTRTCYRGKLSIGANDTVDFDRQ